jgi:hypothetical protein
MIHDEFAMELETAIAGADQAIARTTAVRARLLARLAQSMPAAAVATAAALFDDAIFPLWEYRYRLELSRRPGDDRSARRRSSQQ